MQGRADFRIVKTRIDRRFARIVESCRIAKSDNSITSILRFWAGLRGPIFENSLGHFTRPGSTIVCGLAGAAGFEPPRPDGRKRQRPSRLDCTADEIGWGGRIRTCECRYQKPVPYHLATPQHRAACRGEGALIAAKPRVGSGSSSGGLLYAAHDRAIDPEFPRAHLLRSRRSRTGQSPRRGGTSALASRSAIFT